MAGDERCGVIEEQQRIGINLNPVKRLISSKDEAISQIKPFVQSGRVVADLGCNTGYYTLALAECVGPEGKVYAVDLKEEYIRGLEEKAGELGYRNIEFHASSASDLDFIENGSVDFVLANGLLCNMSEYRQQAVNEIKRVLTPDGQAYISLGAFPPLGFVDKAEWERILAGFKVKQSGGYLQKWALVTKKTDDEHASEPVTEDSAKTQEHHRFRNLRKKLGE